MWLPKDERRLLSGYYRLVGEVAVKKRYCLCALSVAGVLENSVSILETSTEGAGVRGDRATMRQ